MPSDTAFPDETPDIGEILESAANEAEALDAKMRELRERIDDLAGEYIKLATGDNTRILRDWLFVAGIGALDPLQSGVTMFSRDYTPEYAVRGLIMTAVEMSNAGVGFELLEGDEDDD